MTRDTTTPTEDGVDDMVGGFQSRGKIFDEWDIEVLKLLGQSLAPSWSAMDGNIGWMDVRIYFGGISMVTS